MINWAGATVKEIPLCIFVRFAQFNRRLTPYQGRKVGCILESSPLARGVGVTSNHHQLQLSSEGNTQTYTFLEG